jgi:1,4-dihydroxy-2-naphthoate octaprenyltransferase
VAALGEVQAARVSLALVGLAYGAILPAIRRGALPPSAALGVVTAPPVVRQLLAVREGRDREFYGALMGRTVRASARTSGLILLGIVADDLAARLRRATHNDEE